MQVTVCSMTYVQENQLICDKMVNTRKRRPKLSLQLRMSKVAEEVAAHRNLYSCLAEPASAGGDFVESPCGETLMKTPVHPDPTVFEMNFIYESKRQRYDDACSEQTSPAYELARILLRASRMMVLGSDQSPVVKSQYSVAVDPL